ncbi:MAG: Cache 3/Cache 2 fusion domain-containing protein [Phaeodactylibacter sp.]|nr:Cache 3/Cache 2 fusion domain-containing protein [Phaeodactylibacter sp.]MCB9297892.1 Cache 3/Cache 2 fusion domain-containing protein [Lewinellaceae bacterium]
MQLFQKTIEGLAAAAQISEAQRAELLSSYHQQMLDGAPFLEQGREGLALAASWREDLKQHTEDIEWRLRLYGEDTSIDAGVNAMSAYLHRQREEIQEEVNRAFDKARQLFEEAGPLVVRPDNQLRIHAINQVTHDQVRAVVPGWHLGRRLVHHSTELVDRIRQHTNCQATIFQRIPEGFLRISTNIETMDGRRAVGTFIPNSSPVIQAVLKGETYRGSAFVMNNWYASVYEPFELGGRIEGILYIGLKEHLQLASHAQLDSPKMRMLLDEVFDWHFLDTPNEPSSSVEKLIRFFSKPHPKGASHPLVEMGLKELTVLLMQEKERRGFTDAREQEERQLALVLDYIRRSLAEDFPVEELARQACMSPASFYRFFRDKLGLTPLEFINGERLKAAARMLEEEEGKNIQDICLATGFKSCSYFIRLFRERYGMTPKQYQLRHFGKPAAVVTTVTPTNQSRLSSR